MRNLYTAFGLLMSIAANSQPRISVDSVALFTVAEDQYSRGRELLRAKGFVSQFKVYEDGHVDVSVFRQHVGYLSTEKGTGIKTGPNALPALWHLGYKDGQLQPLAEQFPSLTSGLSKPFSYYLQTILGQTGGVQTETTNLTDNTTAIDYAQLLQEQSAALGYRGDVFTQSSMAVENNALLVRQARYQYIPFANRYVPLGQPTARSYPLASRQSPTNVIYASQGTMTYYQPQGNQLITLDTVGQTVQTLALDGLEGKRLLTIAEVTGENQASVVKAGEMQQRVGTDWLFAPAESKAKNPELILVRTDPQGKLVFRHPFTVTHEEYAMTQATVLSNANESLVAITLGKGLLKYVIAYTKVNAQGVVYQRMWDKQAPAQSVRVNGGGSAFKAFTDLHQLVSLPGGENLVISYDVDRSPMRGTTTLIGYGALQLSANGDLSRYYSLRANPSGVADAPLSSLRIVSQPDGRVMLWANEVRNAQASLFSPFSLLDAELQGGGLPSSVGGSNGQPSILVNRTTNGIRSSGPSISEAGGLIGGLGRLADRAASARNSLGLDRQPNAAKQQEQVESSPFNSAPALYWIDTQAGTALVRDFGLAGGYSLPNQPFVVINRSRNEAYIPLRTPPQPTQQPRTARYPQAVYLKLVRMTW